MEKVKLIAKTFQGLEDVLAQELTELGAENIEKGRRVVSFDGDQEMMYRANFELRTAIRILKPIATFKATTADEVYEEVKKIDWTQYLELTTTFAVDSVVYSEDFRNSKFVSYKVKDAIVDYFREKTGQRPNISVADPNIRFNMHISESDCTLSLDSSGESLHKRGYRQASVDSPINEVLAAAMIMMTGWKGDMDFIDPMCGSGTIPIEAALIARNIAPGIFRKHYAFEKWKDFNSELLQEIFEDDSKEREFTHHIYAYDIEGSAIAVARENVKAAGVANEITLAVQPFQKFTQPEEKAVMVMNPPYGERVSSPNILGLYKTIGERLKHQFVGNDAWVIGFKEETFEQIGLKPSLKISLYNGSLNCLFCKYTIFDGQLKNFRGQGGIVKSDEERQRNSERKMFKPHRDFRSSEEKEALESEVPDYVLRRHREFVANEEREVRRAKRAEYEKEGRGDHNNHRGDRNDFRGRGDRDSNYRGGRSDFKNRGDRDNYGSGRSDFRDRGDRDNHSGEHNDYRDQGERRFEHRDNRSSNYGGSRSNYGSNRGGYGSDRSNNGGNRGGYGSDRSNSGGSRGGYGNNRGGYSSNRSEGRSDNRNYGRSDSNKKYFDKGPKKNGGYNSYKPNRGKRPQHDD